ncbi:MAG: multidrug efflux SMR transporter [Planctomycetota bacterium]|jgi:quaternary ammonium compound-resistance protein SugE|nr:multidrug efflux SMR transporter [Planctomycetota bacterium]MDA1025194.1 multidrug efflux SMR transporter [Planctomycetota bacterium]
MAWILVLVSACFEVAWASGLPATHGFTRPGPTVIVIAAMVASFLPLAKAVRTLPIGSAYAVWTGLGATGTAILGMLWHGDVVSVPRIAGISLVILGVAGLRVFSSDGAELSLQPNSAEEPSR